MLKVTPTRERINCIGGLVLAGEVLKRFRLESNLAFLEHGCRSDRIADSAIIKAVVGLLLQGRSDFEDIELFRGDLLFPKALDIPSVPSSVSLRHRLSELACNPRILPLLKDAVTAFLSQVDFGTVKTPFGSFIPVDADVSPFDNSGSFKEGVGRTYKEHDGFSPIFTYVGTEGWLLELELRPGIQHSQKGAPAFFQGCIDKLRKLKILDRCLFRLDSAHDAAENIDLFRGQCDFIIKRNLRREYRELWLQHAKRLGTATSPREGKTVYIGTVEHLHPGGDEARPPVTVVFRVTVRTIDADGQPLLFEQVNVDTWWTSLGEAPETVIRLYEDHATSEQFHSELKSDMDLERLPARSFAVNELFLTLGMIAYNTLRLIDQTILQKRKLMPIRKTVKRRRVGSVIRDIIFIGCKLVRKSRHWIIRIWDKNPWLPALQAASLAIADT